MRLLWTDEARLYDLPRIYDFLASANPNTAARGIQAIVAVPERRCEHPKSGSPLDLCAPRDDQPIVLRVRGIRESITNRLRNSQSATKPRNLPKFEGHRK